MCAACEREEEQFAALLDSVDHAVAMRDGARRILAGYDNPPEGGSLVPRGWVEEHMDELRAAVG
jgi:hypothetical protein